MSAQDSAAVLAAKKALRQSHPMWTAGYIIRDLIAELDAVKANNVRLENALKSVRRAAVTEKYEPREALIYIRDVVADVAPKRNRSGR